MNPHTPAESEMLVALEARQRALESILARLDAARRELIPPPAIFWRGGARTVYDGGVDALVASLDAAVQSVRSARDSTYAAALQVAARAG